MSSMRRIGLVLTVVGILASVSLFQPALGQVRRVLRGAPAAMAPGGPTTPDAKDGEFTDAITLPTDRDAAKLLGAAVDCIKEDDWSNACLALQKLLDSKEDSFYLERKKSTGPDGKPTETVRRVSLKAEANRLIGTMPAQGLEHYQLMYGPKADERLQEAKKKSEAGILAEVALRYLHTKAGAEATDLLGTYFLDRGRYLEAALCFERLVHRQGIDKLTPQLLFKAALAYSRTGYKEDRTKSDDAWKHLTGKVGRDGLALGTLTVSLDRAREELDRGSSKLVMAGLYDWYMYRGNASRTAQGVGGAPFLEPSWRLTTLPSIPGQTNTKDWIKDAISSAVGYLEKDRQQPVIPAFFPIASGGKLVYRAHDALWAVNLKTGKVEWYQGMRGSLHNMVNDHGMRQLMDQQWKTMYFQSGPQGVYFENSLIGSLSTDGNLVFAVDDVAVPAPPMWMQQFMWGGMPQYPQAFAEFFNNHNQLVAVELDSGKLKWELPPSKQPGSDSKPSDFDDTYFLGPPLPLAGKLYVLTEKNTELRLVCIDPSRVNESRAPEVVWSQTLANARDKLGMDFHRRINAVHLAYGEGILVCSTGAGAVLGVDLLSHSLVWAHSYREGVPVNNEMDMMRKRGMWVGGMAMNNGMSMPLSNEWKAAAPAIQDGRVVFTAPDGMSIHCIDLRTGKLLWKEKKTNDDLYTAGVFNGKVVVVSKNSCRALALADGRPVWRTENTGMPSGQGVASDNVYYLPLRAGSDKLPEVCSIDLEKGGMIAHTKSRQRADGKTEIPGNLIFYEGAVISQTPTEVVAYPQLRIKLEQMNQLLARNPKDPAGLTERGELLLDKGELEKAVEDFHTALANKPPDEVLPKTRSKLYDALTELFQRDFNASEKYLKEYEGLCKVEAKAGADTLEIKAAKDEQERRTANMLCLVAKGRETQGRLVDAFELYMSFAALTGNQELISVIDEPATKARPDLWARGRIAAMMARATPENRKPLENKISEQWQRMQGSNAKTDELRNFVALFGSAFAAGKEARLRLAERLLQENKEDEIREAQLHLLQVRAERDHPQLAGQAVEALARLMLRKGLLEHAAHYYRELGNDFANVPIKDGKTGADFFNDLATDKRFLAYLDEPRLVWTGKFEAKKLQGNFPMQPLFTFEPEGEVLPFFQKHRVAIDMNYWQLRFIDRTNNEEYWKSQNLVQAHYLYNQFPGVRHTYRTQGHLVFLTLGHMVYAFDAVDKKKLWEYNLYSPGSPTNNVMPQQRNFMQDKDGSLLIFFIDGWMQRVGASGPIYPTHICLQTRNGLVALDPVRGTVLWSKPSVAPRAQVFGDEQYIYLVEVDNNGNPTGSQVLRAEDGVTVKGIPDFAAAYTNRIRGFGRQLLVKDTVQGSVALRLYDVLTGKDIWKQTFPADTVVLRSEDPNLAGAVEPNGAVTVIDLRTKKVVLKTDIKREDVDKVQEAHLLLDSERFYIAFNKQVNPQMNPWGGPMSNLMYGLRALSVNGMVYAFYRTNGKAAWWHKVENQMLVMEQFRDLPIMQFTSRYNKAINNQPNRFGVTQVVPYRSLDKRTGKLLMDEELPNNGNQFYALNADMHSGRIELVSQNLKVIHEPARPKTNGGPSASVAPSSGGTLEQQKLVEAQRAAAEAVEAAARAEAERRAKVRQQLIEKRRQLEKK